VLVVVTLMPVNATFWIFVTVIVLPALLLPSTTLLKASVVGASVTGATPVPVKVAVCGLFDAASEMLRVALSAPMMEGANVTVMVHFWLAARDEPQVFVCV